MEPSKEVRCAGCGRTAAPWGEAGLRGHCCRYCAALLCSAKDFTTWPCAAMAGPPGGPGETECPDCASTLESVPVGDAVIERCPDCGLVFIPFEQVRSLTGRELPLPTPWLDEEDDEVPVDQAGSDDDGDDAGEPDFGELALTGVSALWNAATLGLSFWLRRYRW